MSPDFRHLRSPRRPNREDGGDELFFPAGKLVSKEKSKSNSSFRVYYGDVPSAVPFTWETIPGTPKHKSADDSRIPPLTPPPSYYANNLANSSKKHSRSKLLLHGLLRRMVNPARGAGIESPRHGSSSSSLSNSSVSWSSSAQSSFSDPINCARKRRRFSSWGSSSSADDRACCFGNGKRRIRSGYSILIVKRALLSIVGRG